MIAAGVLAALAADEWRQSRADARLEESYLAWVALDLRADSATWLGLQPTLLRKEEALDRVLDWLRAPAWDEPALAGFAQDLTNGSSLAYGASLTAERTTFDELVNAGRLELLRDLAVRRGLLSYHRRVENFRTAIVARVTGYAPRAYELVPRDPEFVVRDDLTATDLRQIGERALTADLKGQVIAERNRSRLRRDLAEILLAEASELLRVIERR